MLEFSDSCGEIFARKAGGGAQALRKYISRVRFPIFIVEVQFIDENSQLVNRLTRSLSQKPKYLPRIGERIFLLPDVFPKIQDIRYSGINYQLVHIILEPIPASYFEVLLNSPGLKKDDKWKN